MSLKTSKVKTPIGMRSSFFFPQLASDPAITYGAAVDMGAAVKGYLSVTTVTGEIVGDDIIQLDAESFVSGQLDVETTMSDLQINANLYGHTFTEEAGEISNSADAAKPGGYAFVEPILLKDKSIVYRASAFPNVCAMPSSEKQEADTKKPSEFSPKMSAVSFKVLPAPNGDWRYRQEFATLDAATAWIKNKFGEG